MSERGGNPRELAQSAMANKVTSPAVLIARSLSLAPRVSSTMSSVRSKPVRKLGADLLWDYAVRSLSGRAHSIGEMRVKLRAKAESMEDVEPILSRLKDYGYLDDTRFAATFAAARLENQGLGKSRVMSELMRRRVAS